MKSRAVGEREGSSGVGASMKLFIAAPSSRAPLPSAPRSPRPPHPPPRPGIPCPHPPPAPNPALVTREEGRGRCDSPIPTSLPAQSRGWPDMRERKDKVFLGSDWVQGKPREGPQEADNRSRHQMPPEPDLRDSALWTPLRIFSSRFSPWINPMASSPQPVRLYTCASLPLLCRALSAVPSLSH